MISQTINSTSHTRVRVFKRFFILASICFALLLLVQAYSISQSQINYQQDLMQSVSRSVLKELTQEIATQKLKMSLFYNKNKSTIDSYIHLPQQVDEKRYLQVLDKIKKQFPSSRLYTIVSPQGVNLLEHITGKFLDDCNEEVAETAKIGQQKRLFFHRSKTSAHYDLIQLVDPQDVSLGYFFVAFNIDFFNNLLKKYQLPYQQLYLLRNDKKGFIEVSSQQETEFASQEVLDDNTLKDFEHALPIPDTRWNFAIRLNPESKQKLFYTALAQSFLTWSILTLLLYISLRVIRRNVNSEYEAKFELEQSRKKAAIIINAVREGVISVNSQQKITYVNQSAKQLLQRTEEELLNQDISQICSLMNDEKNIKQDFSTLLNTSFKNKLPHFSNLILKVKQGVELVVAVKTAPILSEQNENNGYVITLEDLSTSIELSKRMLFHEKRDSLTGLFNRQELERSIEHILALVKDSPEKYTSSIILIDFDKFKLLNSSHGFEAGDEFLKQIAKLINQSLGNEYKLCRISSDEFAIPIENASKESLVLTCNNIKRLIRSFKLDWNQEIISASVCLGVVIIDKHFNNINEVLAAADHACRLAKSKGINITQFYETDDPDIQQRTDEINILSNLKKAITEDRLVLFRQEIREINPSESSKPHQKFELLIRMYDLQGSIISPVQFIPAAEKYGLMAKIDRWVIRNAFKHIAESHVTDQAFYSINISSKTLSDKKIIIFVERLFSEFPIEAKRVNFEITETSAISYLDNALDFMYAMKERGCSFSLDDFGTGLASFDYLRKLPIDFLKIDGIFVRDLESNPNDFAFIEAIQKISSQMGIKTVAEFVENPTILKMLKTIGVDYAQGHHIHQPEIWMTKNNH